MEKEIKLLPLNSVNSDVVADNNNSKQEIGSAKGEKTMKNTTTILPTNNPFANTINREAEAKAAAEKVKAEKEAREAAQKALEEDEAKYKDVPDYDLIAATQALSKKGGLIEVKIAGVTIGTASSKEDAEQLKIELHHYGKDLTTPEKVTAALAKQAQIMSKASELVEAGFIPNRYLEVNGIKYLVNGVCAYTHAGHMVASLEDLDGANLPEKVQDELLSNRIKEAVAKETVTELPKTPKVTRTPRAPKAPLCGEAIVSIIIDNDLGTCSLEEAVTEAILEQQDKLVYDPTHSSSMRNSHAITTRQASEFAQRICNKIITHNPIEAETITALYNKISDLVFAVCERDNSVGMASASVGRDIANTVADAIINNAERR